MSETTPEAAEFSSASVAESSSASVAESKTHIRSSSLLLAGRMLSILLNFTVQLLTVRYLSRSDFGSYSYAFVAAAFGSSVAVFGLDKAISRFLAIYRSQGDYRRLAGTVVMSFSFVLGLGCLISGVVVGSAGVLGRTVISSSVTVSLLTVMICLVPLQALDCLCEKVFAVFARSRSLFLRRHILGPGLRLAAVLGVIATGAGVHSLAAACLISGILGTSISVFLCLQIIRTEVPPDQLRPASLEFPARDVFGFSLPLLFCELVFLLRTSLVVFFIEFLHSTDGVAEFRAVMPVARLNEIVFDSFRMLFVPLASGMFARQDTRGINDLYWRTASWITMLSFPVFMLTFSLARPLTVVLFGQNYASASSLLMVLSLGYFLSAAIGANAMVLSVFGRVRLIAAIDAVLAVAAVALHFFLIPRFGAFGASLGVCLVMAVQMLMYQAAMTRVDGMRSVAPGFVRVFLTAILIAGGVAVTEHLYAPPIWADCLLAAAGVLLLVRCHSGVLDVEHNFPELMRVIPFRNWLLQKNRTGGRPT